MCAMRRSTSSNVAPPRFTTKPACFSETCAPPMAKPLSPAWSMSAAAYPPAGRLKVLPAEGIGLAIMNRLSRAAAFRIRNADEEADP